MSDYDFSSLRRSDSNDNKRLLIAMFVSVLFFTIWNFFFPSSQEESNKLKDNQKTEKTTNLDVDTKNFVAKEQEIKERKKNEVFLQNDIVHVGFDVANNRITFFALKDYKQHNGNLKNITLFDSDHYVEIGWFGDVKSSDINWKMKKKDKNSIVVSGEYLDFYMETIYVLNKDYTISIKQKITNNGNKNANLSPYNRIFFKNTDDRVENSNAFHGILAMDKNSINEIEYSKLNKNDINFQSNDNSSWIGISDQYWITALASKDNGYINYSAKKSKKREDYYQIDFYNKILPIEKGGFNESESVVIASPKKLELLQQIEKNHKLAKFNKAIDFGMFYFFSKPLLIILKRLNSICGNFGIAIILLTILVRIIIFPFANRSYRIMAKMSKLAPQIEQLKQSCGEDKKAMQIAVYLLYKENNVNPMAAIVPIFLQIPIFFALYKVLVISIEMRDAPFLGWIKDLSSKDPSSIFNIFGLLPYSVPSILEIGLLPCLMGLTMFVQQKLNPTNGIDPNQQKIMKFLPLIFTIMFASMPAGLVLYWTCSNIFTIVQQSILIKLVNREK